MKNKSDQAYRELRHRLLARNIRAGDRVTEQAWAAQIGVNRSDIRLALVRLEAEGMVIRGKRGGYFAREYTDRDIRQINQVRMILETAALRLAVQRITEPELTALAETCRHMRLMAENGYEMGFSEADIRFHQQLVAAAHNEALTRTYLHANIPLSMTPNLSPGQVRSCLLANAQEHEEIVAAVKAGDAERAIGILTAGLRGLAEAPLPEDDVNS